MQPEPSSGRTIGFLFDLYARNWDVVKQHPLLNVEPDVPDVFFCPLCSRYFRRDEQKGLSREHIPPKSLGGKDKDCTLTCAGCNSTAGAYLDSHLGRKLKADEFLLGLPGASVRGTYTSPGARLKLPMTLRHGEGNRWEIIGTSKSPAGAIQEMQQAFDESLRFRVTWQGAKQSRVNAALLRIAYLWAFRTFGYGLIIHPHYLNHVRLQCIEPDTVHLPLGWGPTAESFSSLPDGIYAITQPQELRSFMVVFSLRTDLRQTRHAVPLPASSADGLEVYERFNKLGTSENRERVNVNHYYIPETPDLLTDPSRAFFAHDIWHHI